MNSYSSPEPIRTSCICGRSLRIAASTIGAHATAQAKIRAPTRSPCGTSSRAPFSGPPKIIIAPISWCMTAAVRDVKSMRLRSFFAAAPVRFRHSAGLRPTSPVSHAVQMDKAPIETRAAVGRVIPLGRSTRITVDLAMNMHGGLIPLLRSKLEWAANFSYTVPNTGDNVIVFSRKINAINLVRHTAGMTILSRPEALR